LKENYLKRILEEGKNVFGPFLKFTDPAVVEVMGFAGFDFVIIDAEHGPISVQSAQNMIRAAEAVNITPIIRVDSNVEGKNNLDEILSVSGIDVIFIGPYDLSQSLGIPGQVNNSLVVEKMKEVVLKCKQSKVAAGTFADDVETAKLWFSLGVQYMAFSVDVGILYDISKAIVNKLKY
jgi:2-keto-3-deoxy-L-rhamnonate aldolase RhmA